MLCFGLRHGIAEWTRHAAAVYRVVGARMCHTWSPDCCDWAAQLPAPGSYTWQARASSLQPSTLEGRRHPRGPPHSPITPSLRPPPASCPHLPSPGGCTGRLVHSSLPASSRSQASSASTAPSM